MPLHYKQAECRAAGGGKPKVLINLSYNGVKVADLKTKVSMHATSQ